MVGLLQGPHRRDREVRQGHPRARRHPRHDRRRDQGVGLAQGALNLAMAINPAFLLAGGIIGAGAIVWKEYSDMQEGWDRRMKEMENDTLRKDVLSGKVKIEDLEKPGWTRTRSAS